jgi:uncharacterized protein (DUF58 family)
MPTQQKISQKISQADVFRLTQRGEVQAAALPPLLVQAEKIAASVILGVHGRRAAGPGESFWQYRPYSFGDSTQRVDWHRSARGGGVFIRENEWESANTLWVWANTGPRMDFKSHLATTTKADRARLVAVAMASLAVRGHERVGALGSPRHAAPQSCWRQTFSNPLNNCAHILQPSPKQVSKAISYRSLILLKKHCPMTAALNSSVLTVLSHIFRSARKICVPPTSRPTTPTGTNSAHSRNRWASASLCTGHRNN